MGGDLFGSANHYHFATGGAGVGTQVDDPVRLADDVEVVFDHDDAVALVDHALEHGEEDTDVLEVKAGGGFVEEEEGRATGVFTGAGGGPFGEVTDQLEPLAFAAAEGVDRLTGAEISEADIDQQLESGGGAAGGAGIGEGGEETDGFFHRGIQQVADGPGGLAGRFDGDFEDVLPVAAAIAHRATDEDIAEELHFDLLETGAPAAFALAAG